MRAACERIHSRVKRNRSRQRLQHRPQVAEHPLGVDVEAGPDEPFARSPASTSSASPVDRQRVSRPIGAGSPSGSRATAPKSITPEPAVGQQPEVARVRVGVQQPGPGRRGEVQQRSR